MRKGLIFFLFVLFIAGFITQCGKLPDERLLERGKAFEEQEKYVDAVNIYDKLIEKFPESPLSPEALYRTGIINANALQNIERGIKRLERVLEEYSETFHAPQSKFMIGFIYANSASDTAKARIAYTEFIQMYPDHELIPSVKWELEYLGKDINDLTFLKNATKK